MKTVDKLASSHEVTFECPFLQIIRVIDYKIYSKSGERVYKGKRRDLIAMERKQDSEKKIAKRIARFFRPKCTSGIF